MRYVLQDRKIYEPRLRYAQLKIQLPEKTELIHKILTNNIDYVEKHWHKWFASKRANGEWFGLDREDVAELVLCEHSSSATSNLVNSDLVSGGVFP